MMVKTCSVATCQTNYKKQSEKTIIIAERETVFGFPDQERKPDLYRRWVKFVNRQLWTPTDNSGICAKHFDPVFIKVGKRKTLKWEMDPMPSNYCSEIDIPPSILPRPETIRKPPTDRSQPDELKGFCDLDIIKCFDDISDELCPPGYRLELQGKRAIFYKMENTNNDIPEVTETIVVDENLHVKLFKKSLPIPLPEWFRKGGHCRVNRKSILENFPSYIKNFGEMEDIPDPNNIPGEIMDELQQIRFKKPTDGPKFSPNLLRYAILLHYTSPQAYKLLLEQFPFPSISLLKKLRQGGVEPLKACKLLLDQGKMDRDVVLLLDEIYLMKDSEYQGGKLLGVDEDGYLFKGVMCFMIVSLKKSIPFVVKAIPETEINGKWLYDQIDSVISPIHECGFNIRAVISDKHSTNVLAFKLLLNSYGDKDKPNTITHPSKKDGKIYLFYDSVHLLKNIRNNLLNARRFIFPPFKFDEFYDSIDVPGGEITWQMLHDVYDQDQLLSGNLRKAPKLSYKTLHPGDNKQSVPLALNIFDRSTAIAITEYFPENKDASEFLKLVNIWWTISNSKQENNRNFRLGNAAILGDHKPSFPLIG